RRGAPTPQQVSAPRPTLSMRRWSCRTGGRWTSTSKDSESPSAEPTLPAQPRRHNMITTTTDPASPSLDERLAEAEGVVFDIDGCLVLSDKPGGHGGQPLPGAVEAFTKVRASG